MIISEASCVIAESGLSGCLIAILRPDKPPGPDILHVEMDESVKAAFCEDFDEYSKEDSGLEYFLLLATSLNEVCLYMGRYVHYQVIEQKMTGQPAVRNKVRRIIDPQLPKVLVSWKSFTLYRGQVFSDQPPLLSCPKLHG